MDLIYQNVTKLTINENKLMNNFIIFFILVYTEEIKLLSWHLMQYVATGQRIP